MSELRSQSSELFSGDCNTSQRQLMWEKLWTTTNRDYGRFSNVIGRQHTNQRRAEVFKPTTWDTTGAEIGAKTLPPPATSVSQHEKAPPSSQRFSRHMTSEVLKIDDVTPKKVESPSRSPVPKSHPKPHFLPHNESYNVKRGWGQNCVTSDPLQPGRILTSGYAKQYITTTQGPFWRALPQNE